MYYLLRYYKDQTQLVGLIFKKKWFKFEVFLNLRILGLNPRLIYLQKVSKKSFLKLNLLIDIFEGF